MTRPVKDQKWKHKLLGGVFIVSEVSGDYVRIRREDGRGLTIKTHYAQLSEHYEPCS